MFKSENAVSLFVATGMPVHSTSNERVVHD